MLTSFVVYGLLGVMGAVLLAAVAAAVLAWKPGPVDDDDTDDTDIYGDEYRLDAGHPKSLDPKRYADLDQTPRPWPQ